MEIYVVVNKDKMYYDISGYWVKELNLNCLFSNLSYLQTLNLDAEIVTYTLTKKRKK